MKQCVRYAGPTLRPCTLDEVKEQTRVDSGTLTDNVQVVSVIAPKTYGIHELMALDVAPSGAGFAAGDIVTGVSSSSTCTIVTKLTSLTYIITNRSAAYTLGEVLTNGVATCDQGAANPTFTSGYYIIGDTVNVLGYQTLVVLNSGTNGTLGTLDVKIQESSDSITWIDYAAFTQITGANDGVTYEKEYAGNLPYIRVVAQVAVNACTFGADIIRITPTVIEDSYLQGLLDTATGQVEDETRRKLLTQTWIMYLDRWPDATFIDIPFGNLQSVGWVRYTDTNLTVTMLTENTDYIVETNGDQKGRLVLPYARIWPTTPLNTSKPIAIRFTCGWESASAIPQQIRHAILMLVSDLYENRGESNVVSSQTVDRLLCSWRLW
jgi:uncharacterized phiE125 gp8 family phage protein